MILDAVSSSLAGGASAFAARFRSARPFPHLVIDEFLERGLCRTLQQQFPRFDPGRARNEVGEIGRKAAYSDLPALGTAYAELDRLLQSPEFLDLIARLTGIASLEYDPEYVGGGVHLNLNGQNLDQHVDFNYHPRTGTHRRLNLLLYLNEEWHEDWGGCLELQSNPRGPKERNEVVRIVPRANRCVIFETSERSWHGFSRVEMPESKAAVGRQSIAVYFYTKDRPAGEAAPAHGTVYVPPALPEHFEVGRKLTAQDVEELQILLRRRDTQIEYLYHRELEFSRILHSPTHRLAAMLTAPLRWLRRRR
jgi:Rps23 Pro-64 3,4-dihydroxylase Tpa1-like proline 4-hydroxylase